MPANISKYSLFLRSLLFAVLTIGLPFLASAVNLNEPLPAEGVVLKYDIFYKGDKVGQHQMRAIPDGDLIRLEHSRNIEVKVAFITAFSESHKSTELWSKSVELQKLNAKTQINGKEIDISGQNSPQGFVYVIDGIQNTAPADLVTLDSYWVGNAPKRSSVMDVAGGKLLKTTSKTNPDGSIQLLSDKFNAKFTYQGDFLAVGELTQNGNTVVYKKTSGN
jgi:hypothetical protein